MHVPHERVPPTPERHEEDDSDEHDAHDHRTGDEQHEHKRAARRSRRAARSVRHLVAAEADRPGDIYTLRRTKNRVATDRRDVERHDEREVLRYFDRLAASHVLSGSAPEALDAGTLEIRI